MWLQKMKISAKVEINLYKQPLFKRQTIDCISSQMKSGSHVLSIEIEPNVPKKIADALEKSY